MKIGLRFVLCISAFTLADPAEAEVILNEVSSQSPDFIELYNFGSAPINLLDYKLDVYSEYDIPIIFTLPATTLDPGTEVNVVTDQTMPGINEIYIGGNINWVTDGSAAVVLRNPDDEVIDFFYLRGPVDDVMGDLPEGIAFGPNPLAPIDMESSYQRTQVTSGENAYFARDWTGRAPSQTFVNVEQAVRPESVAPRIIINEVNPNSPDFIELFNFGCDVVNLEGYVLEVYSEFDPIISLSFPSMSIDPGAEVMTVTDSAAPGVNEIYIGTNINWVVDGSAAVVLRGPNNQVIDFYYLRGAGDDVMGDLPAAISFDPNPLTPLDANLSYQRIQVTNGSLEYFARDWSARTVSQNDLNVNQVAYREELLCNRPDELFFSGFENTAPAVLN